MTADLTPTSLGPSASTIVRLFCDKFATRLTEGQGIRSVASGGVVVDSGELARAMFTAALWSLREAGAIDLKVVDVVHKKTLFHKESTGSELQITGLSIVPIRGMEKTILDAVSSRKGFTIESASKVFERLTRTDAQPAMWVSEIGLAEAKALGYAVRTETKNPGKWNPIVTITAVPEAIKRAEPYADYLVAALATFTAAEPELVAAIHTEADAAIAKRKAQAAANAKNREAALDMD